MDKKDIVKAKEWVSDLYKRHKKIINTSVIIVPILLGIAIYQINKHIDEIRLEKNLERQDEKHSIKFIDELINNIRTIQFYYWSFKMEWTPEGDFTNSQKNMYTAFLQDASFVSGKIDYIDKQSEIEKVYDAFGKVDEKLKKVISKKQINKKTYLKTMDLFKMSINKGINLIENISSKDSKKNYSEISYLNKEWDKDDILAANCKDFINTEFAKLNNIATRTMKIIK